jgi:hypothetical protein
MHDALHQSGDVRGIPDLPSMVNKEHDSSSWDGTWSQLLVPRYDRDVIMPHFKCRDCHHEWDGTRSTCDWCFTPFAKKLETKTHFERFIDEHFQDVRSKATKRLQER